MSVTEFWEEEPRLFDTYRISFENKQRADDEQAWLNGYYVYIAVQTNLYNAFKKETEPAKGYIDKPLTFERAKEIETKEEQTKIREEKIKSRLNKSKKILEEGNVR